MIGQVQTYDKPIQESPNTQQSSIWALRRDWSKVLTEIDKLENNENDTYNFANKKTKLIDNNCKQFMITDDMNIVEAIDNYIDDSDNEYSEINLNDEDNEFIKMSEDDFIKNHRNNRFYHI